MNPSFIVHSLPLTSSALRIQPGILAGGRRKTGTPKLKQPTTEEEQMFPFLPLALILEVEKWAEFYSISEKARGLRKPTTSDEGFLTIYRKSKAPGLYNIPARKDVPEGISMAKKRIVALKAKLGQMKSMNIPLYNKDGTPTKMHVILAMWAYSPDEKGLRKSIQIHPAPSKTEKLRK